VYCFNWTQSSRSLSGSYNEGAVVLPHERLIPTPITPSVSLTRRVALTTVLYWIPCRRIAVAENAPTEVSR